MQTLGPPPKRRDPFPSSASNPDPQSASQTVRTTLPSQSQSQSQPTATATAGSLKGVDLLDLVLNDRFWRDGHQPSEQHRALALQIRDTINAQNVQLRINSSEVLQQIIDHMDTRNGYTGAFLLILRLASPDESYDTIRTVTMRNANGTFRDRMFRYIDTCLREFIDNESYEYPLREPNLSYEQITARHSAQMAAAASLSTPGGAMIGPPPASAVSMLPTLDALATRVITFYRVLTHRIGGL